MIGYYAHSHGSGHSNYAQLLAKASPEQYQIYTSSDFQFDSELQVVRLPDENFESSGLDRNLFKEPNYLHYAPVGLKKIMRRNHIMLSAFVKKRIELLIVDVSVEVAALARVSSVPYAYIKMFGNRNDAAHLAAYEGATFLMAYYPKELEHRNTPKWVVDKTIYTGFFSRYSQQKIEKLDAFQKTNLSPSHQYITVLKGFGGEEADALQIQSIQSLFPGHKIILVGPHKGDWQHDQLIVTGIVSDTSPYISIADYVIGACGANTTAEIATVGGKFLSIPEQRPFQEQISLAQALYWSKLAMPFDVYQERDLRREDFFNQTDWSKFSEPHAPFIFYEWIKANAFDFKKIRSDIQQFSSLTNLNQYYAYY